MKRGHTNMTIVERLLQTAWAVAAFKSKKRESFSNAKAVFANSRKIFIVREPFNSCVTRYLRLLYLLVSLLFIVVFLVFTVIAIIASTMPLYLTVASINCCGLRDPAKRLAFFAYARKRDVQFLCLQKTHSPPQDESKWQNEWGDKTQAVLIQTLRLARKLTLVQQFCSTTRH